MNHIVDEDESSARGRCRKQPDKQQSEEGEENVRKNSCRRDEDESLAPVGDVVKVDRDRPRPSETHKKEHESPNGVEVFERVKGEAARPFGGRITHPVSHPAVRYLMDDDGKKKRNGNKSKCQRISRQKLKKSHLSPLQTQDTLYCHRFNLTIYEDVLK